MDLKAYEQMLNDIETKLDRLRALYEQYFQGLERLEPQIPKKDVERRIQMLRKAQPRNTALRFRTQQVIQKYTTYLTYWNRVARQIEEGTYRRDVLRARQRREEARDARRQERESKRPQAWEIDIDVDLDGAIDQEVDAAMSAVHDQPSAPPPRSPIPPPRRASSGPPPGAARPRGSISPFAIPRSRSSAPSAGPASSPPSATFSKPRDPLASDRDGKRRSFRPPPGARPPAAVPPPQPKGASRPPPPRTDAAPVRTAPAGSPPAARPRAGEGPDIRGVYDRYVEARRRNNERTDNVRYESIEKSINQMLPKLREKHRGKNIDFEVVVKDGKVGLKPVPK